MPTLGQVAQGRDNNFNLIRMVAALAVLVSHAYPIALGPGTEEPLEAIAGRTLGTLAVAVFFVVSGFLIAESFHRSRSWRDFLVARILRLWPGLAASLVVVALLIGPFVSVLPLQAYLSDSGVWSFLFRNLLLATPQYSLPGVFETHPFPRVEGSIWTLFYEVVCYLGLFAAGLLGLLKRRGRLSVLIGAFALLWLTAAATHPDLPLRATNMLDLGLPFATGTAMWLWKDRIPLTLWGVGGSLALTAALADTSLYGIALTAFLAYTTFWLAYIPGGWIRTYNRLGDYSYGVYIYAFPAQGLAVWLTGGEAMTPLANMVLALPLTLIPSVLSWHILEKPALALRRHPALARPPMP
jgi:peptidoglycan/LPS O-acetylase OafA/YrhL